MKPLVCFGSKGHFYCSLGAVVKLSAAQLRHRNQLFVQPEARNQVLLFGFQNPVLLASWLSKDWELFMMLHWEMNRSWIYSYSPVGRRAEVFVNPDLEVWQKYQHLLWQVGGKRGCLGKPKELVGFSSSAASCCALGREPDKDISFPTTQRWGGKEDKELGRVKITRWDYFLCVIERRVC